MFKKALLLAFLVLLSVRSMAGYVPVAVTGFNADVVANGIGSASSSTTAAVDVAGFAYLTTNFQATSTSAAPTYALPASGLINSAATAGLPFQLAAYTGNNSLRLPNVNSSGTLTLTTPVAAGQIFLLGVTGSGSSTLSATVTFTDNTTQAFTGLALADWYDGTPVAIQGVGRVSLTTNALEGTATNPRLYQLTLSLSASNYSKQIASITITKTAGSDPAGSIANIMAVSINEVCTGTPTGGTAQASATTVCPNNPFTLTATGSTVGVGIGYQWESSPTGTTWTPIASATTNPYTLPSGQSAAMQYRVVVSCAGGTGVPSTPVTVNVFNPQLTGTAAGTRCGTGTVTLGATGAAGNTLNWYAAATGGASLGSGTSFVTPVISNTTTYYVGASVSTPPGLATIGAGALTTTNSGNSSGNYVSPYSHYYGGYKAQYLITAAELNAAGVTAGNITSLAFDVTTAGTTYNGFSVSMAATANANMSGGFVSTGFTQVYTGAPTATVGINTYTFTTPFIWNGASNVIVYLCWSNNNGGGTAAEVKYDATSYVSTAYYRADSQTPATICGNATTTGTTSNRPKMLFNYQGVCEGPRTAVAATVTTPPALTVTSPQTPGICTGGSATITAASSNTGYTYLWAPGGQTTSSINVTPASTTIYTVTATDNSTGPNAGCVAVGTITMNVSAQPAAPVVTPATSTICAGTSVMLTGVAGGTGSATFGTATTTNTTTTYPAPYTNYYGGAKHQMLIRASELTAAGMTAGNSIASVQFHVQAVGTAFSGTLQNFQINMGHTANTVVTGSAFIPVPSLVYGPLSQTIPTTGLPQMVTHTFTTPFVWNGTDNIVIQTSYNNGNSGLSTENVQMRYSDPGFVSTNWYRADLTTATAILNSTTVTGSGNSRPNMILGYSNSVPVNWVNLSNLYKNATLTQAVAAGDTNTTVYAAPTGNATYTAVANRLGCLSVPSNAAAVNITPAPSSAITPTSAGFCPNDSVLLSGPTGANLTYVWRLNGNPITGATASTHYAKLAGNYTVTVTNTATGCSGTTATPVAVVVNAVPAATITPAGSTTICNGSSVVLNANTGTGLSYQWFQGGTAISGQTGASYSASAAGSYTVRTTNSLGCPTMSSAVPVAVNVTPSSVTASGTTTFCVGGSVILKAPANNSFTYIWRKDGVTIPGATDSTYTVVGVASSVNTYTVQVTNTGTGCSATSTPGVVVTVGPAPAAPVTPSATNQVICQGATLNLATNPAGGLTYQWYNNNVAITGANSATYGVTSAGTYTVTVSSGPGCTSLSNPITVGVNPLPPSSATALGNTTFCQGESVVLLGNSGPGLTYEWRFNGAPIPGANGLQYTANAGGTYTLAVTNTNGCTGISNGITTTANPLPVATITAAGATTFCQGITVTLNANSGSGLSYQWLVNGNAITGATNSSYTASASGSYTVRVTNTATGCVNTSAATTVTVNPLPNVTTTPAAGPNGLCAGSTMVISIPATTGATYQWKNNGTVIAGANTNSYSATTAGSYTVTVSINSTGCSATSAPVDVTVNPLPVASTVPTGSGTICNGDTLMLTANTGAGLTHQWRLGGNTIAGATSPTFGATAAGSYTVTVTNSFGCSVNSAALVLTVKPSPLSFITYQTPLVFCEGSAVVLSGDNTQAGMVYQWYFNGQPINNTTYFNVSNMTGAYTVKVTNNVGCTRTSAPVNVVVNPKPLPVIVEGPNFVLSTVANNYMHYQWYRNNIAIGGATSPSHNALSNGGYSVFVTDSNGCENFSDQHFLNSVGIRNTAMADAIRLFPNPTNGLLYVEAPVKINVVVRDMAGRMVYERNDAKELDLQDVADGMYMVLINDAEGKLIKAERINKATK